MSQKANTQADLKQRSDVLILFLLRLQELEEREYHKRFTCSISKADGGYVITSDEVEEEYLISYLAVVRQFLLHKECICLKNIRQILYDLRSKLPSGIKAQLDGLQAKWEKWMVGVRFQFTESSVDLKNWELLDLWLHHRYFHADLKKLHLFYAVPDHAEATCRQAMQTYVHAFVNHVLAHRALVVSVLSKGLLPPGQFGSLNNLGDNVTLRRLIISRPS